MAPQTVRFAALGLATVLLLGLASHGRAQQIPGQAAHVDTAGTPPLSESKAASGLDTVSTPSVAEPNATHQPHGMTFRSHPYPQTEAFFILDLGFVSCVNSQPFPGAHSKGRSLLDIGMMKNLGTRWAVGATFHDERGDNEGGAGLMVRGRRWLGDHTAIDVGTGFLSPFDNDPFDGGGTRTAWINQAELRLGNFGSLTAEMQTWHVDYNPPYYQVEGEPDHGLLWYGGGEISYLPGVIAYLAFGLLVVATWD